MLQHSDLVEVGFWRENCIVKPQQSGIYQLQLKRWLDLAIAPIALIVCLPVLTFAALLIVLESQGSPLYRQMRVGRNGTNFEIFKLRTMYKGADSDQSRFRTSSVDERVTRIGKFLRLTKLDELPQLWNVIRGDMSLIGPRPLSVCETAYLSRHYNYSPADPGFQPSVMPGITGLEQIRRMKQLNYAERFALNNKYEFELSFWLDFRIFLSSVKVCRIVTAAALVGTILELFCLFKLC